MNVLITGASGYIGSDFLSSFKLKFPNSILYVLVNNQDVAEVDNIKVIKKDIRDLTKADFDVNFTYVYHLAGLAHNSFSLDDIEAINVEGTRNLLNVLRGKCMNFIYLSSANVYGDVGVNINESFAPLASTTLMLAKLENEKQIMATSFQNVMIFRLALVISYDSPGNIKTVRDMISKTSCLPFAAANKKRS
jgi:nucleoside-diphosphate-sugar epimerase